MKRAIPGLFVAVLAAMHVAVASAPIAGDAEIRKILADRIDAQRKGVGIVVGVIEPLSRRIVAYGSADRDVLQPEQRRRELPRDVGLPADHSGTHGIDQFLPGGGHCGFRP